MMKIMKMSKIIILVISICLSQISYGQKASKESVKIIKITGKVLTQNKMPIVGAVFYIDNIRTGYMTKSNGSYKLKVSSSVRKLKVTSSVYGSEETLIDGRKKINFTLAGDGESELPESNNTFNPGARKMNTYNNIYQMIQTEVSGIVVSGRKIQIRQGHSFLGSGDPLFVVNGVIVSSIDNIPPLEVKSITVLKGSAASIYGMQGTNGVINITLLNGSENDL